MLAVAVDPSSEAGTYCEDWKPHERPRGYEAMKVAIKDAIGLGFIVGTIVPETEYDWNGNPCGEVAGTADIDRSTVFLPSLEKWIESVGHGPIFQPNPTAAQPTGIPDYLNPGHPHYSPRLAAAIKAWQTVTENPGMLRGTTPQKAMAKWLEENHKALDLVQRQDSKHHGYKAGDMNKSAVADVAKVANWDESGGAPATPG